MQNHEPKRMGQKKTKQLHQEQLQLLFVWEILKWQIV